MDIADLDALEAPRAIGPLDVLVNSAGIARHTPAIDTTVADYDAVSDINVRGAYFLSVGAARGMMAAGIKGSIINVTSQMGHIGGIDRAVYCGTKHAVEGFTKAMAIEFGPRASASTRSRRRSSAHRLPNRRWPIRSARRGSNPRSSSGGSARWRTSWARSCSLPRCVRARDRHVASRRRRMDGGVRRWP